MDNIQLSLFGRTYPELFQVTAERILEPCLKKSQTPIFQCLQVANGQPQEWLEGGRLTQLGESLMLNIGEYPNVENESTLSEILEDNVPEKYYLSPKACLGILRRAKSKGRKLPDNLRIALEQKVAEGGEVLGLDFAHADSVVRTYKDITPTLVQNMGRGGGQTPCIMYEEKRSVTNIAYAMVEYGGTMHKAKILTRERLKDGRVALSISITPEVSGTTTITKIQLYDTASKLWAEKSEAIKLKGTQQGVLYRFSFNFKEE